MILKASQFIFVSFPVCLRKHGHQQLNDLLLEAPSASNGFSHCQVTQTTKLKCLPKKNGFKMCQGCLILPRGSGNFLMCCLCNFCWCMLNVWWKANKVNWEISEALSFFRSRQRRLDVQTEEDEGDVFSETLYVKQESRLHEIHPSSWNGKQWWSLEQDVLCRRNKTSTIHTWESSTSFWKMPTFERTLNKVHIM